MKTIKLGFICALWFFIGSVITYLSLGVENKIKCEESNRNTTRYGIIEFNNKKYDLDLNSSYDILLGPDGGLIFVPIDSMVVVGKIKKQSFLNSIHNQKYSK